MNCLSRRSTSIRPSPSRAGGSAACAISSATNGSPTAGVAPEACGRDRGMLQEPVSGGRRGGWRVETAEGVWVYWGCGRRDDTSRVRNLSLGGLFVETREPNFVGASAQIEFL